MEYPDLPKAHKDLVKRRVWEEWEKGSHPYGIDLEHFLSTPPLMVDALFIWHNTPEGADYWHKVARAKTEADLPPLPRGF